MKKISFKLFALMLACFMILPLMFACGGEQDSSSGETQSSQGTQPSQDTQSSSTSQGSTTDSSKIDTSDTQESQTDDPTKDPINSFEELSEREKAFYILNIDADGDRVLLDMSMTLNCDYMGYEVDAEITGETIIIYADDIYTEYNVARMSMTMAGHSSVQTSISGYMDGKSFSKIIVDGQLQSAQYVSMTQEEYLEMKAEEEAGEPEHYGITEDNCGTATCTKNNAGNWVASFTDIDKYGLLYFEQLISENFAGIITDELEDVTLTLTTNSEFLPVKEKIVFEFFGDNPPTLIVEGDITVGDEVETPSVDWSEYQDVTNEGSTPETNI